MSKEYYKKKIIDLRAQLESAKKVLEQEKN
jgi:hypothetical protein